MEEGKKIYYTNSVTMAASAYDITLNLQYNSMKQIDGVMKAETRDLCEIVMSPQHTKVLLQMLNKNLEEYEKMFGEIKIAQLDTMAMNEESKNEQ